MAKKNKDLPDINFDKILSKGPESYNKAVGEWWKNQASNRAHRNAYHHIAQYMKKCLGKKSEQKIKILDYACGDCTFLEILTKYFPNARFYGVDGSQLMLSYAKNNFAKSGLSVNLVKSPKDAETSRAKVTLIQTFLPKFNLLENKMDVAVYLFPNMTCGEDQQNYYNKNGYRNVKDVEIAEMLARFREMDPEDEIIDFDKDELFDDFMTTRVLSRNLRKMTKKGGFSLRVEYANAKREELSELTNWRSLFTEGALQLPIFPIKDRDCDLFYKYISSEYRRSSVILDVYHQTGEESDKEGGYFCSWFQAV